MRSSRSMGTSTHSTAPTRSQRRSSTSRPGDCTAREVYGPFHLGATTATSAAAVGDLHEPPGRGFARIVVWFIAYIWLGPGTGWQVVAGARAEPIIVGVEHFVRFRLLAVLVFVSGHGEIVYFRVPSGCPNLVIASWCLSIGWSMA